MVAQRQVMPPSRPFLAPIPRSDEHVTARPEGGPARIGPYDILYPIDHGEIVGLYAVRHSVTRVEGGVRMLRPALADRAALVQNFVREARQLARVQHPGVLAILGVASDRGVPYAITDPLRGRTLAELIEEHGTLPEGAVVAMLRQLAEALAAYHADGQAHGGLGPASVLIAPTGEVTLLPHRCVRDDAGRALLLASNALGPAALCPPERSLTAPPAPEGDVYALGMMARSLLRRERIHPALPRVLDRCTAPAPADRPSIADVDTLLAGLPMAQIQALRTPRRRSREYRGLRAGLALAGMGLGIFVVGNTVHERDRARAAVIAPRPAAASASSPVSEAPPPSAFVAVPASPAPHPGVIEEAAWDVLRLQPVLTNVSVALAPAAPVLPLSAHLEAGDAALLPEALFGDEGQRGVVAAINAANAAAIAAERTGNPSLLAAVYEGEALTRLQSGIHSLLASGRRRMSTLPEIVLLDMRMNGPDQAEVRTRERWRVETVRARDGRSVSTEDRWHEQIYRLTRRNGHWLVSANEVIGD